MKCKYCSEEISIYGSDNICDNCFGEEYNKLIKSGVEPFDALDKIINSSNDKEK